MWMLTLWNHPMPVLQWGVVLIAVIVGAMTDLAARRIPNWLTGPLLLSGVVSSTVIGHWAGLADSLAACVLLGVPYVILFIYGGGGAGDAKLMMGIGAWLGLINGLAALLAVSFCAIVLGLAYAAFHGRAREVLVNLRGMAYGVVWAVASKNPVSEPLRAGAP